MRFLLARVVLAAVLCAQATTLAPADFYSALAAYEDGDYATALREWLPLARRGDVEAQYHIARIYHTGEGLADDELAVRWYREAAEQGHAKAQNNLGLMLEQGRGVERSFEEAAHWYFEASRRGMTVAYFNLAVLYEEGRGVETDPVIAAKWYRRAADRDHAGAQYRLGSLHERGEGVLQSADRAAKLYRRAAKSGYAAAQLALGVLYESGRGVEQNAIKAAKWYRKASAQGLTTPWTSPPDQETPEPPTAAPEQARATLTPSPSPSVADPVISESGAPSPSDASSVAVDAPVSSPEPAASEIADAAVMQIGSSPPLAREAEGGDAEAQYELAARYANGDGVPRSWGQAARWYLEAARQGHAMAGYKLALLYLRGHGPDGRDYVQAYVWFDRSARKGLGDAIEWRDRVSERMNRKEKAEAERLLRE